MKRNIFVCLLAACMVFVSCGKEEVDYAKYFVGRYSLAVASQITDSVVNVSPSTALNYVMTINRTANDSVTVMLDSTYSAKGYVDEEGMHVDNLTVKAKYLVSSGTEGNCNFTCTMNFVQFVMPKPISNGTNQISRFRATTTGTGTIDRVTHDDLVLNDITGTSIFNAVMTNDPSVIITHDTTLFPAGKTYQR